ncbi:pyridoxamine 5'-phosphate oxidase family protein [Actinophytocola sp.]|uniref:pyridoxamine 5'-phosphate oxidase family protein n=1 Tax=Actinophytocola sp. TaxID=1872138 RepID=UPI002ED6B933
MAFDSAAIARAVMDANSFVTLATADADGRPWASPVWFATEDYRHLYWVSAPDTRHSRNLAVRPELAMVVYDSTATPLEGQAVYMTGTAAQVTDGIEIFSRVSVRKGLREWGLDRVTGDARLRLYRATVTEHHILDPDASIDVRAEVSW